MLCPMPQEYIDLGSCRSMAIEAETDEQFKKLSFQLRRTSSLHTFHHNISNSKEFMQDAHQCSRILLPNDILFIRDDFDFNAGRPDKYVDYLSHNWNKFELLDSWKFIRLLKRFYLSYYRTHRNNVLASIINNNKIKLYNKRLENISWRIWYKLQLALTGSRNWLSDSNDTTWLYGPLVTTNIMNSRSNSNNYTTTLLKSTKNQVVKPILKKRNVGETIEKNSLWKLRQIKRQINKNDTTYRHTRHRYTRQSLSNNFSSSPYSVSRSRSETSSNSSASPSSSSSSMLVALDAITTNVNNNCKNNNLSNVLPPSLGNTLIATDKHIRFSNKVEQCIAIQNSKSNLTPRVNIIEQLPSTNLNYHSDSEYDSCLSDCDTEHEDKDTNYGYRKRKAVSHNVCTSRRYPYIYDYNSVYKQDVTDFLPSGYTCDIIDLPENIELNIEVPEDTEHYSCNASLTTSPLFSPLAKSIASPTLTVPSTAQGLMTSNSSFSSTTSTFSTPQVPDIGSAQSFSKTRDFITGQIITNNSPESSSVEIPPTLYQTKFKTASTAFANFIFTSSDESDF